MPGVSWCQIWSPAPDGPGRCHRGTFAAPALVMSPTASPGTPATRSSNLSSSKLPAAREDPERVAGFGGAYDRGTVLMPELAAGAGQPGGRTEQHVGGAGIGDRADVFAGHAHGQVVEAVIIEVADRQRGAERIGFLGDRRGSMGCSGATPGCRRGSAAPRCRR